MEKKKRLVVDMPEDMHLKFKILAVKRKTTMTELVMDYIRKVIQEDEKKKHEA
ncbi:hypothetical protein DENIS_3474 [Desulfonema ishimotonii]|uniref:Uncharacterized protein n=1 Tax=Desulfonema ishimotonii TaxID=45657 RepID=A0A401FZT7_9BACT|nr:plasmid partition protein ParG [Desulfonema ishimotonii]GBC62502.1 hypothetical protein DENIS_3474 [Desulfonema ishimotonii]